MLSLLDVAERAQRGHFMEETDWDLALFKKVTELVRKYELKYPGDGSWFNTDDDLVERAFQAGIDFIVEQGVYCMNGKVVHFSRNEVMAALKEVPNRVVVGEGRDARVLTQKKIEGTEPPNVRAGHHAPFTEDLAPLVVKNFAQLPFGDYIEGFNFAVVDGREIYGMPIEVYAARRQLFWMREGVRKAGRPGMAIAYYPINTRAAVLLAPMDPDYGLRRTDGILLSILPGVKFEIDLLTAAIVYDDYGCFKVNGGGRSQVGGFCGGPEGAIVEAVAKPIVGWMCYKDTFSYAGVGHILATTAKHFANYQPIINWASSVACQALNTKTKMVLFGGPQSLASGPGRETYLIELAVAGIHAATNGLGLSSIRQGRARMNAAQTPLDHEWAYSVACATMNARIKRPQAGEIVARLAKKLEGRQPEPGMDIRECYDLVRHQPSADYDRKRQVLQDELVAWGLVFD